MKLKEDLLRKDWRNMSNTPEKRKVNKIQQNKSMQTSESNKKSKGSSKKAIKSQFYKDSSKNVSVFAKGHSQKSKFADSGNIEFKNKQMDFEDEDSEYDSGDNENKAQ